MTTKPYSAIFNSGLGRLRVTGAGDRISGISLVAGAPERTGKLPARVRRSLELYFRGKPSKGARFSLEGTPFQKKIWQALTTIPWGDTVSYAQLARRVRRPKAVRAVARAVGQNPVAILLPCHRVVGSDGSLTGYAYGLKKKKWLLSHEKHRHG